MTLDQQTRWRRRSLAVRAVPAARHVPPLRSGRLRHRRVDRRSSPRRRRGTGTEARPAGQEVAGRGGPVHGTPDLWAARTAGRAGQRVASLPFRSKVADLHALIASVRVQPTGGGRRRTLREEGLPSVADIVEGVADRCARTKGDEGGGKGGAVSPWRICGAAPRGGLLSASGGCLLTGRAARLGLADGRWRSHRRPGQKNHAGAENSQPGSSGGWT